MQLPIMNGVYLLESANPDKSKGELRLMLEDGESPVVRKMHETLYEEIIEKRHIDFADIPASKGDFKKYKGFDTMVTTLDILHNLSKNQSNSSSYYVGVVTTAVNNMVSLSDEFKKGFSIRNDLVELEYNTYAYTCIQGVSTLLNEFVDYIKRPDQLTLEIKLKDSKYRADNLYITNLEKFNTAVKTGDYRKYITGMMAQGKDNFIGLSTVIGAATLATIAVSVIPVTRELVFQFYNVRRKVSENLALQAYLIDMNKLCIEGNTALTAPKKAIILKKQEDLKLKMLRLSDKLRVDMVTAREKSKRELSDKNGMLKIDNIKKEISDSPLELL